MKLICIYLVLFLITLPIIYVNAAVMQVPVKLGEQAKIDFGNGHFLIQRILKGSTKPQYIVATGPHNGNWFTADGKETTASSAHMYWNGTLVFKKITSKDLGSYYRPLEERSANVAQTVYNVIEKH